MKSSLPLRVNASSALSRGSHYAGILPISQFPRLVEALATEEDATLEADLKLERDAQRAGWLRGAVRGALPLTCQRCLRPFSWPLDCRIELRLVTSEAEESRLLQDFEPLLVEDDVLPLREIVEDEVLLALPLVPRCTRPDCAGAEVPP